MIRQAKCRKAAAFRFPDLGDAALWTRLLRYILLSVAGACGAAYISIAEKYLMLQDSGPEIVRRAVNARTGSLECQLFAAAPSNNFFYRTRREPPKDMQSRDACFFFFFFLVQCCEQFTAIAIYM